MKHTSRPDLHNLGMTLCLLAAAVVLSCLSERIFQGDGLGFDGVYYGDIITRYEAIASGELPLNPHLYLRSLPAMAARQLMLLLGFPLDKVHVVLFFQMWNVGMLGLAALAWGRTCDAAGLSSRGKWLGFCGLFVNYAILKYAFYYPVLLDTTALALSLTLAWLYAVRRQGWILIAAMLSMFISPPVGLEGFLLFLFPRPRKQTAPVPVSPVLPVLLAALASGAALSLFLPFAPLGIAPDMARFQTPAKLLVVAYIFAAVLFLSRDGRFLRFPGWIENRAMAVRLAALVLAAGGVLLVPALFPRLPSPDWPALFRNYVVTVLYNAAARPGEFLVAHTLYFGPVVLLGVCLFPRLCTAARPLGNGMVLVLAFGLLQFVNPLSRQMIGAMPFFVLALCLALDPFRLPGWFLWAFAAASLAVSKVWMHINAGADPARSILEQPNVWQRYVSSTGNWMHTQDYLLQGAMVLGGLAALAVILRRLRRRVTAQELSSPSWSGFPEA